MMAANTRYIFFDIDGTIAYNDLPPSAKVTEIFKRLREKGHKLFISTARSITDIYPSIIRLGFDGIICSSGSQVFLGGSQLYCVSLPLSLIREIVQEAMNLNLSMVLEGPEGIYLIRGQKIYPADWPYDTIAHPDEILPEMQIQKFSLHVEKDQELKKLLDGLREHFKIYTNSDGTFIECISLVYGKEYGMREIMRFFDADLSRSVVFGDSMNDYGIIKECGFGIAMANAPKELLDAADMVTGSVFEDGIATAAEKLGLI